MKQLLLMLTIIAMTGLACADYQQFKVNPAHDGVGNAAEVTLSDGMPYTKSIVCTGNNAYHAAPCVHNGMIYFKCADSGVNYILAYYENMTFKTRIDTSISTYTEDSLLCGTQYLYGLYGSNGIGQFDYNDLTPLFFQGNHAGVGSMTIDDLDNIFFYQGRAIWKVDSTLSYVINSSLLSCTGIQGGEIVIGASDVFVQCLSAGNIWIYQLDKTTLVTKNVFQITTSYIRTFPIATHGSYVYFGWGFGSSTGLIYQRYASNVSQAKASWVLPTNVNANDPTGLVVDDNYVHVTTPLAVYQLTADGLLHVHNLTGVFEQYGSSTPYLTGGGSIYYFGGNITERNANDISVLISSTNISVATGYGFSNGIVDADKIFARGQDGFIYVLQGSTTTTTSTTTTIPNTICQNSTQCSIGFLCVNGNCTACSDYPCACTSV